jgi:rhamnogalacturonan endolyase
VEVLGGKNVAKMASVTLFKEDWSKFPAGPILRDNTARGEYMAMVVPENPNGWYHNASAGPSIDRDHSPFTVKRTGKGRVIEMPRGGRGWGPSVVLTPGPRPWRDYVVTADITVKDIRPVGLVARYQTNRDYCAALFECGVFKLVRVLEGAINVLASAPLKPSKRPMRVTLEANGTRITAQAGGTKLAAQDGCITWGGVGLWANGPAAFGKVVVQTTQAEADRLRKLRMQETAGVLAKRRKYPQMELIAELDVRGHAIGRQVRFADLDGDGRKEILFAVPTYQKGRIWRYNKIARLSALSLDGDVLWERGRIQRDSTDITADLPFQAGDRGNGVEVVAAFGSSLEVLDPQTGKTRKKTVTPKPPKMEPYWDEINMYWGDGHFDDLPRLLPDSIRLCNFTGRHPYGDLLIKDRYHNAWAIDGRTLKVLWHHRCNTGHYPYAADINGDGRDEVLLGYSRVDSKGNLIGRLYLGDHPDACFTYVDCNGVRHNLHPCGEAGLIDEYSDRWAAEVHLGHVQHLSIANFIPDRPDLERIIVTYHGNQGIIVLLDMDDRILRKVERYGAGAVCQPVNWTGDGRELIAFSPRHGDGGLWDEHFDLVVPFPNDHRPGKYMEVQDVFGWGIDQLLVWDEQRLHIYAPKVRPKARGRRYTPIRPEPNLSNYQVNYSLPRWE